LADFTNEPPELQRWLQKFQQNGVPLTVIFSADRPNEPIVLPGVYTQGKLLESLKDAPPKSAPSARLDDVTAALR
jgi:suppressor for copper-sensitivity B